MYRRAMIGLISVLSCCALACVGFSAWSITTDDVFTAPSSGTLTSEDVILSDEYVKIDEDLMKTLNEKSFNVTPNGFANAEGKVSYEGSFSVPFLVNAENCRNLAKSGGVTQLRVEVTLRLADNAEVDYSKVTFSVKDVGEVSSPAGVKGSSFTASFMLTPPATDSTLTGTFTFNFQNQSSYKPLYEALVGSPDNHEVTNPFTLVVAVSNEAA